MNAPRTTIALAGLSAIAGACNAVLGIQVLDNAGVVDAGGDTTIVDAMSSTDAVSDASRDASASDVQTDALPGCGSLSYGTDACAACASAMCCSQAVECAEDPVVCAPYESCLGMCNGDAACRSRCTIDNPVPATGSAFVSALSACLAKNCENECGLPCGAFAGYLSEPDAATGCQSCIASVSNACGDSRNCGSSVDCDAYWRCYRACATPDCRFACASAHDAGLALFRPLQQDYSGSCAIPCAFGNYWACVGHISWPAATEPTVQFTVPVIDFITHLPVPGESVSICASCPCGTADDPLLALPGTTDDAGTVTLSVQQVVNSQNIGLNGCVQVNSPDASDGGTVQYYGYWGYPLSESVVNPALGPSSPAANIAAESAQTFTPAELAQATAAIGEVQDPMRGLIGAAVFDCLGNPAPGVRVAIDGTDPLVSMYYGQGDAGTTTSFGFAFFYNVPTGIHVVTATPASLDASSSVENINVVAGTTVAVGMFPTPAGAGAFPQP